MADGARPRQGRPAHHDDRGARASCGDRSVAAGDAMSVMREDVKASAARTRLAMVLLSGFAASPRSHSRCSGSMDSSRTRFARESERLAFGSRSAHGPADIVSLIDARRRRADWRWRSLGRAAERRRQLARCGRSCSAWHRPTPSLMAQPSSRCRRWPRWLHGGRRGAPLGSIRSPRCVRSDSVQSVRTHSSTNRPRSSRRKRFRRSYASRLLASLVSVARLDDGYR